MPERQVNMMIPKDVWEMVDKVVAGRILEGKPGATKKAVVAEALEAYCKKNGVTK